MLSRMFAVLILAGICNVQAYVCVKFSLSVKVSKSKMKIKKRPHEWARNNPKDYRLFNNVRRRSWKTVCQADLLIFRLRGLRLILNLCFASASAVGKVILDLGNQYVGVIILICLDVM